jgi:Flp pilus assembly protein TadG
MHWPFGSIETLERVYRVIKSNRGQLSIFMGITLILVMGMLAFIINIGLFVKAKINLQNAVDAAAFSGAATQARQLTNIAYANWEMRNTYKEWMFKYYVLGQIGLMKENPPAFNLADSTLSGSSVVNFKLRSIDSAGSTAPKDKLNVPTICVHNNSSVNICSIFSLPGIPRFPAIGVAGISDIHEAFVNKLVQQKSLNCSDRTQINYLAALSWAYSSGIKELPGAPLIATNRAGAWPESIELAMRIRNLEMIVNRPAVENIDFVNKDNLSQIGSEFGLNERPVKAFMSAFRNLGGGKYKDRLGKDNGNTAYDELAKTFKLTEISPQPFVADENSVSGFLIPKKFNYSGDTSVTALTKAYLDLQVVPVNYATMFSTFASLNTKLASGEDVASGCGVSKSAMPVPGYLMGFVKNPAVLTYYAVKGEAEFTGLFFPSSQSNSTRSFKLTAYAAAKPFGGRIGPKLFAFKENDTSVVAREDAERKSSSYISGIDLGVAGTGAVTFKPGDPIPPFKTFWVNPEHLTIGGIPNVATGDMAFGIPNMIYDFDTDQQLADQNSGGVGNVQMIGGFMSSESRGLYNSYQMKKLKSAIGGDFTGKSMTSGDLMRSLVTARQVTKYDAANYLIPNLDRSATGGEVKTNVASMVKPMAVTVPGGKGVYYKLFAPLVGNLLLYENPEEVKFVVANYMEANKKAVKTYLESLLQVANSIFELPNTSSLVGAGNLNEEAAKSIHINANGSKSLIGSLPPLLVSADPTDANAPTCAKDMASKFHHFFIGSTTQCGIVPLEELMVEYIEKKSVGDGRMLYTTTYFNGIANDDAVMTAYYPGPRQGALADAKASAVPPIGSASSTSSYSLRRNFYSTKFIPLSKVMSTSNDYKDDVFLESDTKAPMDIQNITVQNLIPAGGANGLNNPFFLDF